jgi:uncharacterized protein YggE
MKNIILSLTFLLMAIHKPVLSQSITEKDPLPYIEVNGVSELYIVPDQIFIGITLKEKYDNKEKVTIESQEDKLKSSLKEIGVDIANLSLTDANAYYTKVRFKTKDVMASKYYSLKVTDASKVALVFQQLDKLEIFDADVNRVDHSKIDSLRKVVRVSAIKAAKTKAEYLLSAIGEQVGKALVVNEQPEESRPYYRQTSTNISSYSNTRFLDDDKGSPDDNIQFQKLKIKSNIYVKFAIK